MGILKTTLSCILLIGQGLTWQLLNYVIYLSQKYGATVEPRYKEVRYNKTLFITRSFCWSQLFIFLCFLP